MIAFTGPNGLYEPISTGMYSDTTPMVKTMGWARIVDKTGPVGYSLLMRQCTKCKRHRDDKYIVLRKVYNGKKKFRCRARSVCSSIARRKRES